jgi:hypothetical protein
MFEILKILIDTVGKALSPQAIAGYRKKKKLADLGKELFLLYSHLNEVIVTGYDIVSALETYVQRMGRHLSHSDDAYALTAGSWIRFRLVLQRVNLARLGGTLQRLSRELSILDGESYRRLRPLLDGKRNALDTLLTILGGGQLPLVMADEESILQRIDSQKADDHFGMDIREEIGRELRRIVIPTTVQWDGVVYEQVRRYLTDRNPRGQLKQLEEAAKQLHTTLKSSFDISDILLKVSDERYSTRYEGEFFW